MPLKYITIHKHRYHYTQQDITVEQFQTLTLEISILMSLEISLHKRLVDIRIAETVPNMTTLIDEM